MGAPTARRLAPGERVGPGCEREGVLVAAHFDREDAGRGQRDLEARGGLRAAVIVGAEFGAIGAEERQHGVEPGRLQVNLRPRLTVESPALTLGRTDRAANGLTNGQRPARTHGWYEGAQGEAIGAGLVAERGHVENEGLGRR